LDGLEKITSPSGASFWVAKPHAERFRGLIGDLESSGYGIKPKESGGYNYRNIAGTNKLSQHAHGNAIDINWMDNARGTPGNIPPDLARQLAQKHGMKWGGDWKNPDPMHFEVAVPGQPGHTFGDGHNHGAPPAAVRTPADPEMPGLMPGAPRPASPMPAAPTGAAPAMTPYNGPSPDDVSQSRRMAQMLMQQGMSTEPVGHWTQALARVLQGGVGGMYQSQAKTGEQQGNASIAAMLQGGGTPDVSTLIQNPWTRDIGKGAMKATLAKKLAGSDYGKQGAIFQGEDGRFYSIQFGSDGNRRIEPVETGGKPLAPAKGVKQVGDELVSNATGGTVRNVAPQIAGGERAKAVGEAEGKAVTDLGRVVANAEQALQTVEQIRNHPGKGWGTGVPGVLPAIPGTDQAGFVDLVNQAKGKAFLEAFNSLKGGGAITEAEGQKATQAIARLERARKPQDFDAALKDFEDVVRAGVERAKKSAGGQPAPAARAPAPGGWSLKRLD
jgi:hypothetical protein